MIFRNSWFCNINYNGKLIAFTLGSSANKNKFNFSAFALISYVCYSPRNSCARFLIFCDVSAQNRLMQVIFYQVKTH